MKSKILALSVLLFASLGASTLRAEAIPQCIPGSEYPSTDNLVHCTIQEGVIGIELAAQATVGDFGPDFWLNNPTDSDLTVRFRIGCPVGGEPLWFENNTDPNREILADQTVVVPASSFRTFTVSAFVMFYAWDEFDCDIWPDGGLLEPYAFLASAETGGETSVIWGNTRYSLRTDTTTTTTTTIPGAGGGCDFTFNDALNPREECAGDEGSIYHFDIEWLAAEGITRGCNPPDNTLFCPGDFVTRGQMAAFLVRALSLASRSYDEYATYVDVSSTHVFFDDVGILGAEGITRGCNPPDNSYFCPDESVTRGQMAAFMTRALNLSEPSADSFTDDDGSVFEQDIEALAAAGITLGCNPPANDRFCPDEPVTRGQMAAFLHRALGS